MQYPLTMRNMLGKPVLGTDNLDDLGEPRSLSGISQGRWGQWSGLSLSGHKRGTLQTILESLVDCGWAGKDHSAASPKLMIFHIVSIRGEKISHRGTHEPAAGAGGVKKPPVSRSLGGNCSKRDQLLQPLQPLYHSTMRCDCDTFKKKCSGTVYFKECLQHNKCVTAHSQIEAPKEIVGDTLSRTSLIEKGKVLSLSKKQSRWPH